MISKRIRLEEIKQKLKRLKEEVKCKYFDPDTGICYDEKYNVLDIEGNIYDPDSGKPPKCASGYYFDKGKGKCMPLKKESARLREYTPSIYTQGSGSKKRKKIRKSGRLYTVSEILYPYPYYPNYYNPNYVDYYDDQGDDTDIDTSVDTSIDSGVDSGLGEVSLGEAKRIIEDEILKENYIDTQDFWFRKKKITELNGKIEKIYREKGYVLIKDIYDILSENSARRLHLL
jgi:hypothetical protein